MSYELVSADGHINEPPGLWTKNAPSHLESLVPHVVSAPDSGDMWVLAPTLPPRKMGSSAAISAKGASDYKPTATYKEMRPGSFDPLARVEDMKIDGLDAEVLYPGQGRALDTFATEEVRLYCARIYNEWIAEFQAAAPERLVGLAILPPLDDGDGAVTELERAADLGLRGAFLALSIDGSHLGDPSYEKFWATAAERRVPISFHIGNSRHHWIMGRGDLGPGEREATLATLGMSIGEQLGILIFSGVLDRQPELKIVLAECGIGWIGYFLQRMDQMAHKHGHNIVSLKDRLPSEIFRDQVFATFQEDVVGVQLHELIGESSMMWASDYPHSETTWPDSRAVVETQFKGTSRHTRQRILADNCVELYELSRQPGDPNSGRATC